jgi:polyisoprenyl-teichoic acid--peptidoglycan teichoic acid transferase
MPGVRYEAGPRQRTRGRRLPARVYRRRRLVVGVAALLLLSLVGLAGSWAYTLFRFGQIASVHVPGLRRASGDGGTNLLVVGSDSREGLAPGQFGSAPGQRGDVVLLVHLVPRSHRAAVLSLPRDLYLPIAGTGGSARLNSAMGGGPGRLVETVTRSFGVPIDHYLLVDFAGFRKVVDALGGVDLRFPRPVRDSNHGHNQSGLEVPRAGCQHLDGDQALALARSRYYQYRGADGRWHDDPGFDLGRIRRQQVLLRAMARRALARRLANPVRANAFIGSLVHSLTVDDALTVGQAVALARQFRAFDPGRLGAATLPTEPALRQGATVLRPGDPAFQQARGRPGWEQILLPRQPAAQQAVARFLGQPGAAARPAAGRQARPSPARAPGPSWDPVPC